MIIIITIIVIVIDHPHCYVNIHYPHDRVYVYVVVVVGPSAVAMCGTPNKWGFIIVINLCNDNSTPGNTKSAAS